MATVTSCMKVMAWLLSLSHELFCMGLGTSTSLLCGGKTFRTAPQEANGAGLGGAQNSPGTWYGFWSCGSGARSLLSPPLTLLWSLLISTQTFVTVSAPVFSFSVVNLLWNLTGQLHRQLGLISQDFSLGHGYPK